MLYQQELGGFVSEEVIDTYWTANPSTDDARKYADELVCGIEEHRVEIDGDIAGNSMNWKISRMAAVDKNILRIAVYELKYRNDVPSKVAINEAVEIAKKFGTADSGAFVNGILDNIARAVRDNEGDMKQDVT
jgi:N utilization substance protein B